MEELHFSTEEKMVQVFGPNTTSRSYGVHMDGKEGTNLFTQGIVNGVWSALRKGARQESSRSQEQKKEQEVAPQDVWSKSRKTSKSTSARLKKPSVPTYNRFQSLN